MACAAARSTSSAPARASSASTGSVNEDEIARLASFGGTYADPDGGTETGLNAAQIQTFMNDNLKRAGNQSRWYYPLLMKFEWPVLLKIMGKGQGDDRYLSVAEVRTLFNERKFPDRITQRVVSQPVTPPSLHLARCRRAQSPRSSSLASWRCASPINSSRCCPSILGHLVAPPLPKLVEPRGRVLARAKLGAGGPALVSSRQPGHGDLPGAL